MDAELRSYILTLSTPLNLVMAQRAADQPAQTATLEKQQHDSNTLDERLVTMHQRNTNFEHSWLPFRHDRTVSLVQGSTTGALKSFNPPHPRFTQSPDLIGWGDVDVTDESALPPNAEYEWSSRGQRKGRHALVIRQDQQGSKKFDIPPASASLEGVLKGILAMFTTFPYNNISWLIAIVFTLGSIVWILSSFFAYMPMDKQAPPSLSAYGCGVTSFVGSCVFVTGSILLMVECVNDNRDADFGWGADQVWDQESGHTTYRVMPTHQAGSQQDRKFQSWKPSAQLPTMKEIAMHHCHDFAFWYTVIQLLSSFIFLLSGITALPKIYNALSPRLVDVFYWTPKLVACVGFITSAIMAMIECQRTWYQPAWKSLGWHIGLWKCLGSLGFFLVPCFGYNKANWAQYVATVHCLWGSWAFLIGSFLLWYESVTQYTVTYAVEDLEKEVSDDNNGRRDTVWSDDF